MDVDDADRPGRLRVPVGGGDRRRLLEPEHVLEPRVRERVEERQLRRARVAEEIADAGRAEDLHQEGGDVHGRGVGVGGPYLRYAASMAARMSESDLPSACWRITSRVMFRQSRHVAAWLVKVICPSDSALI